MIGVEPNSLVNFRGELIKAFENIGKTVITVSLPLSVYQEKYFLKKKIKHVSIIFQRNSLNPIADLRVFLSIFRLYRQQKPETILAFNTTIFRADLNGQSMRKTKMKTGDENSQN